jgi:hypothetical protein
MSHPWFDCSIIEQFIGVERGSAFTFAAGFRNGLGLTAVLHNSTIRAPWINVPRGKSFMKILLR